jgi:hypothetical protein
MVEATGALRRSGPLEVNGQWLDTGDIAINALWVMIVHLIP